MADRGDVYRRNLTLNTISSLACVGGSGAKGQSEHGSVEMPVGWTMSFPQPLLKDRALPPADKTFRLNTRSCGSRLSWGFPNRLCGQEFHPFPDSSWNSHSSIFFLHCLLPSLPLRCFSSLCDSHERCVHICRLFLFQVISYLHFLYAAVWKPNPGTVLSSHICRQLSNNTQAIKPTIFSNNQAGGVTASVQTSRALHWRERQSEMKTL